MAKEEKETPGKLDKMLRVDAKLHAMVKEAAKADRRSVANFLRKLLEDFLEGKLPPKQEGRGAEPITIEGIKGEDRDLLHIAHSLTREDKKQWIRQGIYYLRNPTDEQDQSASGSAGSKMKPQSKRDLSR